MSWQPGQPVVSEQDHKDWEHWRRERKREAQRLRRARYPRIDYYPDDAALALIDQERRPRIGGDASSIINRIVREWAQGCGLLPPE